MILLREEEWELAILMLKSPTRIFLDVKLGPSCANVLMRSLRSVLAEGVDRRKRHKE